MRSLTLVQLGARAHSGGGSPAGQDVGSSASPVPAVFDDGQPLLCGSWEAGCSHSRQSSSGRGHAVAEGPRLARTWRRTLGGLTWQKLMVSARRQSPESRGGVSSFLSTACSATATWSSSPVLDHLPSLSICLCAHTSPFHSSTSHGYLCSSPTSKQGPSHRHQESERRRLFWGHSSVHDSELPSLHQ